MSSMSTRMPLRTREIPLGSILLVEDSEPMRRSLRQAVEEMQLFDSVFEAGDGFAALRLLRQHEIDVVLCDLHMPRCDGMQLLRLCQGETHLKRIPFLVLSAAEDVDTLARALDAGASDFVAKPARHAELRARLKAHLKLKHLYDELCRKTADLEQLSRTDTLTGLPNRRHLDEVLEREVQRWRRYGRPLSLMMLDLDHFKQLNDRFGHAAGDRVLEAVAGELRGQMREADVVARYGGEEFTIVLPETELRDGFVAAERVRAAVASIDLQWERQRLPVSCSIGLAGMGPGDADGRALLQRADGALYDAKRAGRNRVVGASSPPGNADRKVG